MMRLSRLGIPLLLVVLSPVGLAHAAERITFEASHYWDPYNLCGLGYVGTLTPGTVTCPQGEPSTDPMSPCGSGNGFHLRDMQHVARFNTPTVGMSGWMTVVDNGNFLPDGSAAEWGTFTMALDTGGTFEGTFEGIWHAHREFVGDHWTAVLRATAHGAGGTVEGMQMTITNPIDTYTLVPICYSSSAEITIVDPKATR